MKIALEMADWKDQQFKEYLEKKKAVSETRNGESLQPCGFSFVADKPFGGQ